MQNRPSSTSKEKPRSQVVRSEITRLPRLTPGRRFIRRVIIGLLRILVAVCTRTKFYGLENVPPGGPVLVVSNHLGDVDVIIGVVGSPVIVEAMAKAELYDYPVVGRIMDAYGVIWVHRGQPDRRALRAALDGLQEGRMVAIAPEARESTTGALEQGTEGAAYLALKAGVPILPVTFTGTENARVYGNLKKLRRTEITMTVGNPFKLDDLVERGEGISKATEVIMCILAAQLPERYRGVYRDFAGCEPVIASREGPVGS